MKIISKKHLKTQVGITIVAIIAIGIFTLSHLNETIAAVGIGAIIGWVSGLFTVFWAQYLKDVKTKEFTSKALFLEVKANQDRLQLLIKPYRAFEDYVTGEKGSSNTDTNVVQNIEKTMFPKSISFDRTIYSTLSDKIGLLEPENGEIAVQYYVKIKLLEDQYKMLVSIHGTSPTDLGSAELVDELEEASGRVISHFYSWAEIKETFADAEKAYIMGEELKECLKGNF